MAEHGHGAKKSGYMHEGMHNKSPPGDSGMRPPSGSVNSETTRESVAPTPRTLGPREA
jgi:hypothetical protein